MQEVGRGNRDVIASVPLSINNEKPMSNLSGGVIISAETKTINAVMKIMSFLFSLIISWHKPVLQHAGFGRVATRSKDYRNQQDGRAAQKLRLCEEHLLCRGN